jgi:hypothetical protein
MDERPLGFIMYTTDGYMSAQLMRPNPGHFASVIGVQSDARRIRAGSVNLFCLCRTFKCLLGVAAGQQKRILASTWSKMLIGLEDAHLLNVSTFGCVEHLRAAPQRDRVGPIPVRSHSTDTRQARQNGTIKLCGISEAPRPSYFV